MTPTSRKGTFPRNSWRGTAIPRNNITGLCLILDQDVLRIKPDQAMAQALSAGVRVFQYRSKTGTRRSIYDTASMLAKIARKARAVFIVNDHADIAAAVEADGVHLGQDDLPIEAAKKLLGAGKVIGVSTHNEAQAILAERSGADYIGFGPIFPTATKDAGKIQGIEALASIRRTITIPIIAIGGIGHENAAEVLRSGADGVAVISAILSASDIAEAAGRFVKIITEAGKENSAGGIIPAGGLR